jgi:hypothetical protein
VPFRDYLDSALATAVFCFLNFGLDEKKRKEKEGQPESLSERNIPEPGINNLQTEDYL